MKPLPTDHHHHRRMVAMFDIPTLRQMEADLGSRRLRFSNHPDNRWCVARLEAIRQRLAKSRSHRKTP